MRILDVRPVGVARYTTQPSSQRDYQAAFHVDVDGGGTLSIDIAVSARHADLFRDDDEQREAVYRMARDVVERAAASGVLKEGGTLELSDEQAAEARTLLDQVR